MNVPNFAGFADDFRKTMSDFRRQLDQAIKPQDLPMNKVLDDLSGNFDKFQNFVLDYINKLSDMIKRNDNRIDELENYSRRNCLIFHGIPEQEGESIDSLETEILKIINELDIPDYTVNGHIDRCHRLGRVKKNSDKNRAVIVKFISYKTRKMVWSRKKNLRGKKYLITESLSASRLELYKQARKVFGDKEVWTVDGRITLRIGRDFFTIRTNEDMEVLKQRHGQEREPRRQEQKSTPQEKTGISRSQRRRRH